MHGGQPNSILPPVLRSISLDDNRFDPILFKGGTVFLKEGVRPRGKADILEGLAGGLQFLQISCKELRLFLEGGEAFQAGRLTSQQRTVPFLGVPSSIQVVEIPSLKEPGPLPRSSVVR